MLPRPEKLLTRKELAFEAGVSPWYVTRAKGCGFVMPGRRATLTEFREWLRENPGFCARRRENAPRLRMPPFASPSAL
jgi:hypothetical protein